MVSGFEKYFQIARCFRDEDLRADRQFEFTQIDLEISFPTEEDVFDTVEAFLADAFAAAGIRAERPFPRLTYREAMDLYGTDRPDLRYDLPLSNLSDAVSGTGFAPFARALEAGGTVRGLRVPGGAASSRKRLDELAARAKEHGAGGLVWVKVQGGEVSSPAKKGLSEAEMRGTPRGVRDRRGRPAADRRGPRGTGARRPRRAARRRRPRARPRGRRPATPSAGSPSSRSSAATSRRAPGSR